MPALRLHHVPTAPCGLACPFLADLGQQRLAASETPEHFTVVPGTPGTTRDPAVTPLVTAIRSLHPAAAETGANSAIYAVDFNASVTGVDAADFQVVTTGSAAAVPPVVVAGGGTAYTVTVNGVHGSGELRLDLIDNDSIRAA